MKQIIAVLFVMTSLRSSGQLENGVTRADVKAVALESRTIRISPDTMKVDAIACTSDVSDLVSPTVCLCVGLPAPMQNLLSGKFPYDDIRDLVATLPGVYQQKRGDDVHISGSR